MLNVLPFWHTFDNFLPKIIKPEIITAPENQHLEGLNKYWCFE